MTRYDCKTANGVDDCLQRTAAARAAAEATADATAAGPVRTTWDDDSDAAFVAATEAAEQAERARQARRRPMRVDRLAQVAASWPDPAWPAQSVPRTCSVSFETMQI